ncbi:hypothetical protein HK414_21380 [Ramlibacter terrae]|uniref:Uncharacterized protein n=1 Tax=Ramlibacter terrae TaxID=2732511 RepID=A0ABX6P4W8_9BURK|nr:hypothetical protein HK414_21380 [Ramlibacter terrae]
MKASFIGVGVLFVTLLFALFLGPSGGVAMNTDAWPDSAKEILKETPGQTISPEQWRRIDHALERHGANAKGTHLLAAEIRKIWPVFVPSRSYRCCLPRFSSHLAWWRQVLSGGAMLARSVCRRFA